ncbi:MAG: DUF2017 family protein [Acidimicrobiales bacterium]
MSLFNRRRVARTGAGTYRVRLPEPERTLLGNLADQLRDLLLETTDDPAVRRLFPTAYNEDPERDREYQQLVRDELLERRLGALATVEETLAADELTDEQLSRWLSAVNDLRLVLGTRLDVSEDPVDIEADDPDAPAHAVYDYLGFLLSEIVDALAAGLPAPTDDSD